MMNKASGGDGIPAELFQILKYDVKKKRHARIQSGGLWRLYKQLWKEDKQRQRENVPTECRVPENSKERFKGLLK